MGRPVRGWRARLRRPPSGGPRRQAAARGVARRAHAAARRGRQRRGRVPAQPGARDVQARRGLHGGVRRVSAGAAQCGAERPAARARRPRALARALLGACAQRSAGARAHAHLRGDRAAAGAGARRDGADGRSELALGHALPGKILEHRSLAKLKGTYADTLPGLVNPATGRIHTTFNQLVASTGRLSSQDPNLMNIPIRTELGRRIRAAFIPAAGWRFVAADYSQIELRILAHLSGDPAIIEAFRRGEDIHTRTASEVFRLPPAEVTPLQRTIAKSANFAILYGVSAFGLSQATKIDQKAAQRYIDDYFAAHPRVRAFIDATLAFGREHGFVTTLLGRRP